jgi:hypothetical protein
MRVARRASKLERRRHDDTRRRDKPVDERTLRTLIAAVQTGIARATAPAATADDKQALTRAWDALVQHLALGPAPETRPCPAAGARS